MQTCQVCDLSLVSCKSFCSLVELFQRLVVDVVRRPLYDVIAVKILPELHNLLSISGRDDPAR